MNGVFDPVSGKIYIVADAHRNGAEAVRTLLHEAVGEYGIDRVLPAKDWAQIRRSLLGHPLAREVSQTYAGTRDLGLLAPEQQDQVARETLSKMAENPSNGGGKFSRVIPLLKAALRRMGIKYAYSHADLMHIVQRARETVARESAVQVEGKGDVRFSLQSQPGGGHVEGTAEYPAGKWIEDPDSPTELVYEWTKPPTSAAEIVSALKREVAGRRLELIKLLEAEKGKRRRTIAELKQEKAWAAELAKLNREAIPRARAIVAIPKAERGSVTILKDNPESNDKIPFNVKLGFLPFQGVEVIETYTDKTILPRVRFKLIPELTEEEKAAGKKPPRAKYDEKTRTVFLRSYSTLYTAIHEITHGTEHQKLHVFKAAQKFLLYRSKGKPLVLLRDLTGVKEYKDIEYTFEDEWVKRGGSAYSGKYYSNATEILTVGIERLHTDPLLFATMDEEYFSFVVNTLRQW